MSFEATKRNKSTVGVKSLTSKNGSAPQACPTTESKSSKNSEGSMIHLLFKLAPFVTVANLPPAVTFLRRNAGEKPTPCLGCNAQEDGYEGKWDITE